MAQAITIQCKALHPHLDGYRFLSSESEESIVAREPLLHVEENDA